MAKSSVGSTPRDAALLLLALGVVLAAPAAYAGLGEASDSILRDHVAFGGSSLTVTSLAAYDVHETATTDGARVRQYVAHDGTVFAVGWSSRTQVDLRTLLAGHYDAYVAAASVPHGANHHVFSATTPGMVISIMKHPRGFTGAAYVPAAVPAGVSTGELR
jgi:Protein of unknown function (DUF2844)